MIAEFVRPHNRSDGVGTLFKCTKHLRTKLLINKISAVLEALITGGYLIFLSS
jgi:hypothetical protein